MNENERTMAALKFMVFSMGLALIGGLIFLFFTVYQRNQAYIANPDKFQQESAKPLKIAGESCNGGNVTPDIKGRIISADTNGRLLTMMVENEGKQSVLVVDFCNARVISELTVKQ